MDFSERFTCVDCRQDSHLASQAPAEGCALFGEKHLWEPSSGGMLVDGLEFLKF